MRPADERSLRADPVLVEGWVRARSVSRGLPAPVADHGGWRVDTGLPQEVRRYVFATPSPGLSRLAQTIREPGVFIKLCSPGDEFRPLLPGNWSLEPTIAMMTCETAPALAAAKLPSSYVLDISTSGEVSRACIHTRGGELAASGYAAEVAPVFIYDRIRVEPAHRRRGLGRMLMSALGVTRRSLVSKQILVATAEGQALYATLGWTVHAPYTTATIMT